MWGLMKFAVIKTGGKQYRVAPGDVLRVEKLPEGEVGKVVTFSEVLLAEDGTETKLGTPHLAGASVTAEYVKLGKADKVLILKYKNKTRYRVKRGHRQPYSEVKITSINA